MTKTKITAVILTYNEEEILEKCLEGLDFVNEIIIFDSFSTDNTLIIAKKFNATVIQRKFDNYATQRNIALNSVNKVSEWILMVDADEIVTKKLKTEILTEIEKPDNQVTLYRIRRKDIFKGKWIKHSSGYPTWFPRLFKNGDVRVEREINEEYFTTGKEGTLNEHLIHYPFNKGISYWFEKHNRYSEMEAKKMLEEMSKKINFEDLFSKKPVVRRKCQKRISYHLPFRPTLVFVAFYFLKGGFLDGKAGYIFCKLRKTYEWMIHLKFNELKSHSK